MTVTVLQILLQELEQDRSPYQADQLQRRVEALDRLETCLIHAPNHGRDGDRALIRRADAVAAELEAVNRTLCQSVRNEIKQGHGPAIMSTWLAMSGQAERDGQAPRGDGYDYLDVLVSGVLQFDEPGEDIAPLAPEMVFYQPTPARHIFDLIRRMALVEQDVVMDLGSGLGHVSLLSAICTPAQCVGIELEEAYVTCARESAQALNLRNATFIQQDARYADFSRGTVFYLYTPFTGTILRHVLDRLKDEATRREIRLCTLGPCTAIVGEEQWLKAVDAPYVDRIAIFRSVQEFGFQSGRDN